MLVGIGEKHVSGHRTLIPLPARHGATRLHRDRHVLLRGRFAVLAGLIVTFNVPAANNNEKPVPVVTRPGAQLSECVLTGDLLGVILEFLHRRAGAIEDRPEPLRTVIDIAKCSLGSGQSRVAPDQVTARVVVSPVLRK